MYVAYVFDVMSREYFIHQIDFFFFSYSYVHIYNISNVEAKKKIKQRFRNIRSKIQTYMFSCADTHHMFVSLLCMLNQKKKEEKKECAPKNCSNCEIFCFIKYGLNKKKFRCEFSLVQLITHIKKSYQLI